VDRLEPSQYSSQVGAYEIVFMFSYFEEFDIVRTQDPVRCIGLAAWNTFNDAAYCDR